MGGAPSCRPPGRGGQRPEGQTDFDREALGGTYREIETSDGIYLRTL